MLIQSINPQTNKVIKEFEAFTKEQIDNSVLKAKKIQSTWSKTNYSERKKLFLNLKKVLTDKVDSIGEIVEKETGKIRVDYEAEIYDVIDAIDYYLDGYKNVSDKDVKLNELAFPDTDLKLKYVPYGVIALIMPWNFPLYSPFMFVMVSILTGNVVLLKPSEYSTMVAYEC